MRNALKQFVSFDYLVIKSNFLNDLPTAFFYYLTWEIKNRANNFVRGVFADFYAINISVKCERSSGYLLLSSHKPLETIALNSQFFGRLRSHNN